MDVRFLMRGCTNKTKLINHIFLNFISLFFHISLNFFLMVGSIATHRYGGLFVTISFCNEYATSTVRMRATEDRA